MQSKSRLLIKIFAAAVIVCPATAFGQSSSINTYSPYSFFGLGDLSIQGSASIRAMGGAGVALRDYYSTNILNPASYSAVSRQSALFAVGLEGQNYYLSDENTKSSFNSFNIRDIAFQLPLARGLGVAMSINPYSSVGYRVQNSELTGPEVTEIGYINRMYSGSGGLNQIKLGAGWELWKGRLSIGAEAIYYHGKIERTFSMAFDPIVSSGSYVSVTGTDTERINTVLGSAGFQAMLIRNEKHVLSLGGVYKFGGKMRGEVTENIPFNPSDIPGASAVGATDTIRYITGDAAMEMPHIFSVGLYYARPKFSVAADYTYSMWGDANNGKYDLDQKIEFRNTHTVSGGLEWTPNPMDIRHYLNRCSYRIGVRYSDYYMRLNDQSINDKTITFGIGFPLDSRRRNSIDLGLEAGMRGTHKNGLIKENYFKISLGFKFFGDDFWFQKYKYN